MQVLQHCLCLDERYGLYVVAKCGEIIYSVLLQFSNVIMSKYKTVITTIFPTSIPWLTDHERLPNYQDGADWGYATNRLVAVQQLQLRDCYIEAVLARGCPLPELRKMHPFVTTGWNKTKVGVELVGHFTT